MSELNKINNNLINVNNNFSDNNIDLAPYVFWRYEFNKDSKVNRIPFKAPQDHSKSWSNYKEKGLLNVYKIKK